jgi:hypothetical protein
VSLALRPRQLVHRGVVEASGLLVDEALSGAEDARRRVVAMWAPGVTVHRVGPALLVRFAAPRRIDCARAPGLPLVRVSDAPGAPLASAPLAPDEVAAAAPPRDAVLLVRAGALTTVVLTDAAREDPASYLDLSAFDVVQPDALGPAPAGPMVLATATAGAARELLGVAAAPPERAAAMAALRASGGEGGRGGASAGSGSGSGSGPAAGGALLPLLGGVLSALATLLARLFPRGGGDGAGASAASAGNGRALSAVPQAPAGPSLAQRLSAQLRRWIASALVRARLAQLLGRRQAEYFDRLLDMFDRGDLGEALRHAIPLGGAADGLDAPAFGVPSPRRDLSIALAPRRGAGSTIFTELSFHEHLRRKYRAAFERLEREGRIDEAAFVLAELLQRDEEAVAFLERHGHRRRAAELAEARGLPPGLVVRQWFLAGDVARAVRLARRHDAFADALVRLEKHERAPALRLLWANTLADAGDFAAAVDVIWPIEEARHLGRAWIDLAIDQGGGAAARMLVRKLDLVPASFPDVREKVLALLADTGSVGDGDRRAFAEALMRGRSVDPLVRTLVRPTLRALVRDGGRSGETAGRTLVEKLAAFTDDPTLRADLPRWPTVERIPLAKLTQTRRFEVAASDTGATPILDAASLPGGRTLVALGEAGVRVLSRDGRPLFHLDQPAHRLVVSDRGDRALALAPRGDALRVARLDLVRRRSEAWCEAPRLEAYAADFDGAQWVVASGSKLLFIDALEPRFEALASVPLEGQAAAVGRSPRSCTAVVGVVRVSGGGRDIQTAWSRARFDLPSWTLRANKLIPAMPFEPYIDGSLTAAGATVAVVLGVPGPDTLGLAVVGDGGVYRLAELSFASELRPEAHVLEARDGWIACAAADATGIRVRLLDEQELVTRAEVTMSGAKRASVRLGDDALTIADDRGRVFVLDLAYGGLLRDLRV